MTRTDTVFRDLPASRETLARPPFHTLQRRSGDLIVSEGDARSGLYLLERGTVQVFVDGTQVAALQAGSVFGEIGLFTNTVRTATVRAGTDCVMRLLERSGYDTLRAARDPIAGWIERRAIRQLLTRFRQLVADVKLQSPHNARNIEDPVSMARSAGTFVPLPRNVLAAALATVFPDAPRSAIATLAVAAQMRVYSERQTLTASGLRDSLCGMVVEGEVAAMVPVDEGSLLVTTLVAGEMFGPEPLADNRPRPVHHVTRTTCTILWIDPALVKAHLTDHGLGTVLRSPLLNTLAAVVTRTNATVSLGELTNARVVGASQPMSSAELPPLHQRDFDPLPLDLPPPSFDEPEEGDWDTWFDVTAEPAP